MRFLAFLSILDRLRIDILNGVGLLTRLPAHWGISTPISKSLCPNRDRFSMARSVWTWPLIGYAIGLLQAFVLFALLKTGFQLPFAVLVCIIFQLLLTGCLHEDGLADCCDGFGGGHTIDDKLRIMRDSQIGTYGVLALIMLMLFRYEIIIILSEQRKTFLALPIACSLGRMAMSVLLYALPFAQKDGLARSYGKPSFLPVFIGVFFTLFILYTHFSLAIASLCIVLSGLCICTGAYGAFKQVKGISGDILGANCLLVETVILTYLAHTLSS